MKNQARMIVIAGLAATVLSVLAAAATPSSAEAGVQWGGTSDTSYVEFLCDRRFGRSTITVSSWHNGHSLFVDSGVKFRWWEQNLATGQWFGPMGPYPIGYTNRFNVSRGLRLAFYVQYTRPGFYPWEEWGWVKQDGALTPTQSACLT